MSEDIVVDARGLSCPEPVILAKQAMRQKGATKIEVAVDSAASGENVRRTARLAGWTAQVTELPGGEFRVELTK